MKSNIGAIQNLLQKTQLNSVINLDKEKKEISIEDRVHDIPLELIEFDPDQPRREIIDDEVVDIVRTLRAPGSIINQPISVWPINKDGKYLLKMGEKRTRASRIAGRKTIRAIIDTRFEYGNAEHRAINYAEQYIENHARGGLQPLDECMALYTLKQMFGNLNDVVLYVGEKSAGTISDLIKTSEIARNPDYQFLLDFYHDKDVKLRDLTTLRKLIKAFEKNKDHYDLIKDKIIKAVNDNSLNRVWVDGLLGFDFNKGEIESVKTKIKKTKSKSKAVSDNVNSNYIIRPVKKAKIFGRAALDGRKKVNCQLILDRLDNEEGFVWVLEEGKTEPQRVSLSKLALTEIL